MKRDQPSFRQFWDSFFRPFRKLSPPAADLAWQRVLDRLRDDPEGLSVGQVTHSLPAQRNWSPWVMAAVAASLLAVVGVVVFRNSADPLVAVAENQTKIRTGEPVRAPSGMKLTLTDGSRLNMLPGAELSFYRTAEDLCVQLVRGDLVVNAAKQEVGHHLCVQTTDLKVTVIGTVFTVRVERRGSSVIVEEGTVWVQQGSTRKTLVAGGRFSTIPAATQATPQVSALTAPPQARATAKPAQPSYDVISIRKTPPDEQTDDQWHGRVGPAGLRMRNATLKELVLMAYDLRLFQVSGGPAWINKDRFTVETKVGPDVRVPEMTDPLDVLLESKKTMLLMMQDMLATRFKLKVRRTTEQSAAYALVLDGKTSKLQAVSEFKPGSRGEFYFTGTARMADLAEHLSQIVGQPVVDRTGLPGLYDIKLNFMPESDKEQLAARGNNPGADTRGGSRGGRGGGLEVDRPDLRTALKDQLGLKLEKTKAPVEFLVIQSVEKPSEN